MQHPPSSELRNADAKEIFAGAKGRLPDIGELTAVMRLFRLLKHKFADHRNPAAPSSGCIFCANKFFPTKPVARYPGLA
jgi:hypothetical protein